MSSIDMARALVPRWVVWGALGYLPLSFVVCWLTVAVTARLAYVAPAEGAHWTERARALWSARRPIALATAFVVLACPMFVGLFVTGVVVPVPPFVVAAGAGVAGLLGVSAAGGRLGRRFGQPVKVLTRWRSTTTYFLVMLPHLVAAAAALAFQLALGRTSWLVIALGVVLAAAGLWGGGFGLSRALGLARPASARLTSAVHEAARRSGTTPRPVYEIAWHVANALAFPQLQVLAFTTRAVAALSDHELAAIASHELAHLDEPAKVRGARVSVALFLAAAIMVVPASVDRFGVLGPLAIALALAVVVLVARRLSRRMEARADGVAHQHGAHEAGVYARALERLYEINLVPAVLHGRPTHPHLYDRILAAGVEPSYPRPLPPARRLWAGVLAPACLLALVAAVGFTADAGSSKPAILIRMALQGGSGFQLGELAYAEPSDARGEPAATLYRAEADLGGSGLYPASNLAIVLGTHDRCDESARAYVRASEVAARRTPTGGAASVFESAQEAVMGCWAKRATRGAHDEPIDDTDQDR